MRILTYKVPYKLTRNAQNEVDVEVFDQDKKLQDNLTETIEASDENNIPSIAKRIGDENSSARTTIKATLLSSEDEAEGVLTWKLLAE